MNSKTSAPKGAFVTSLRERVGYNTFWVGQNLSFIVVTTFLAVFYTTALGIPAEVVGTLFLLARLWDAVVDPLLATVVERSHFKAGKYRPWIIAAAVTVPVMTVLCFGFDGVLSHQPLWLRVTYAAVTYVLWGTIYAASDAPAYALSTAMTPEPAERNRLLTFNQFTSMIGILLGFIAVPAVLSATNNNWLIMILVVGVITAVTMIPIRFVKERVKVARATPPRVGQIWKSIVTNKYLMLTVLMGILANGSNFILTLTPFVMTDLYGGIDPTVLLMSTILPILVVAPFGAMLIRRFGKIPLLAFSFIGTIVLSIVTFLFCRDSYALLLVFSVIRGFITAPQVFMLSLFFSDSVEYDQYRNGNRFGAATFATQTMMSKISLAIAGAVPLWIIGIAGYISSTTGKAVKQPSGALDAMWVTYALGPVVGLAIATVLLLVFYDLTEPKLAMMVAENRRRNEEAELAATQAGATEQEVI